MRNAVLGGFIYLNPLSWNYGFPTFSVDEIDFKGLSQVVYSMHFLFIGFTITLDSLIDNGSRKV